MEDSLKTSKKVLGKSGLEVSGLCFGTLAFSIYHSNLPLEESAELLVKAYNSGINFWDSAELYETYSPINLAFKKLNYPQDIIISSRSYARTYKDMKLSIEKCLEETNRDYIEIFGLHEVQKDEFSDSIPRPEAMKALIEAKRTGLIKAISLTTHSAKVVDIASNIDEIDVIMPLINYKGIGIKDGSLKDMESAIEKAKRNNIGIYAMKVLAGGYFIKDIRQAINYINQNKNIDSIAIGMASIDELEFNLSLLENNNFNIDLERKIKSKKRYINIEPWCVGCQNCIKTCPQEALILEFGQAKIIHEKCIRCGYCISACKDFFIKFLNK